jgi:hypothetical protein
LPALLALVVSVGASWPGGAEEPVAQRPSRAHRAHTGSLVHDDPAAAGWVGPAFRYEVTAAAGPKLSRVLVLWYDPVLESEGGKRLSETLAATDPEEASRILADVVRQASWGYVNHEVVEVLRVDGYPRKVDGFRYDDASYLEARRRKEWHPAPASYRAMMEENGLVERFRSGELRELWVWGADGFHIDEFAGFIPGRDERYPPTDNPWLYRPYDIPPELGRTVWVMGFNVEVGPDNAVHSYCHRVESMAALAYGGGRWDAKRLRDPWNLFSRPEMDVPGRPAHAGNCHAPPNAEGGYDYGNRRRVATYAWDWWRYPDLSGAEPRPITSQAWGGNQFGYLKWWLERLPKGSGATERGYNNWWVHVANTDLDLPAVDGVDGSRWRMPAGEAER